MTPGRTGQPLRHRVSGSTTCDGLEMQGRHVEHTNEAVRTSPPTANEVGRRVRQTALGLENAEHLLADALLLGNGSPGAASVAVTTGPGMNRDVSA